MIEYKTAYETVTKKRFCQIEKNFFTQIEKERMNFAENFILYSMVQFLRSIRKIELLKNQIYSIELSQFQCATGKCEHDLFSSSDS